MYIAIYFLQKNQDIGSETSWCRKKSAVIITVQLIRNLCLQVKSLDLFLPDFKGIPTQPQGKEQLGTRKSDPF